MELLAKEWNEVALAFSRDVECFRTGAHHIAVAYVCEIDADDFERAAVQLRLSALVRNEQRVDDCAPMVLQREEVLICDNLRALRKLHLQTVANPRFIRD